MIRLDNVHESRLIVESNHKFLSQLPLKLNLLTAQNRLIINNPYLTIVILQPNAILQLYI